jgi:predicted dienelactone hydrolase
MAELRMIVDLFKGLGDAKPVFTRVYKKDEYNSSERDLSPWTQSWDMENISIIGHSFGGTLAASLFLP